MTIAAIEFDADGRPCRIIHMDAPAGPVLDRLLDVVDKGHRLDEEDVNWCERDQCYYQNDVGSWTGRLYLGKLIDGVRHRLWARPDITFSTSSTDAPLTPEEVSALGYDLDTDSPKPSLAGYCMYDGATYYCERCDDNIPDMEHCEHVYWCGSCGCLLDKKIERCEHYCDRCECELHTGDCDRCFELPAEAA